MTTIKERILAELGRDRFRSSSAIGAAVGCKPEYVRVVARRHGLLVGRSAGIKKLSTENIDWLQQQARQSGVTFYDMLDAVVTDARCEQ